jgi:hypothetical protein
MKSLVRIFAVMTALLPVAAFAQEPQTPPAPEPQQLTQPMPDPQQVTHPLAGFWKGTITAEGADPFEFSVQFRIQGDVVTGPILSTAGEVYLKDGTVTANSIAFTSPRPDLKEGSALVWTGQLTGDNKLDVFVSPQDNSSPAIEVILTKADQ